MNEQNQCPQCGAPLAAQAPEGLCPACLLKQGADADTATQPNAAPFDPPPRDEVARLFPQLEIIELIGKGGMGAVYKARQPALDRWVALKILPPLAAPGFTERFNREARALARLTHPNIVAVHEFGQAGALSYFLMEFVDGLNLRQIERAGKLTPREALQIIPQICEALQFAHDEGIVHRDIKPENILLDKKGRVKIADFGIAKILGREQKDPTLTEGAQVIGTPHYMAPEQVEKPQSVDHRADIFSLGVVFYEMLTGELPLGRFQPPSRKVQVDVRLDEVVLHALEKEPARRYQHAREVKTDVETIASAAPAPPRIEPAAVSIADKERIRRQVRRPAIGLLVTGILNWILIPLAMIVIFYLSLGTSVPASLLQVSRHEILAVGLGSLVLCSFMIAAALKMMRLEGYWAAKIAGVLAIMVSPGNIVGLPVGLWVLLTLERRDVRDAFGVRSPLRTGPRAALFRWPWLVGSLVLLGLLVFLAVHRPGKEPNLLVSGTVTDVVTAKPIAGARVADNRYGASPNRAPQEAWTDAEGRFGLRTWSEEHTVSASAPGYETKLAVLMVSAFGREREARLDFQLQPTNAVAAPPSAETAARALNRAAVQGLLRRAEAEVSRLTQLYEARLIPLSELEAAREEAARDKVEALRAELDGDAIGHSRVTLAAAERKLQRRSELFKKGVIPASEYEAAKAELHERLAEVGAGFMGLVGTTFGPVIERVVSGEGDTNQRFIDLDNGQLVAATEYFGLKDVPSPEEPRKWQQTGFDAMGDTSPAVRGLVGFEMVAFPIASQEWDKAAPDRSSYWLTMNQHAKPTAVMSGQGALPATYVFRTRDGGRGLLQIIGFAENPPGVKIRYKLVQARPAGGTTSSTETGEPDRQIDKGDIRSIEIDTQGLCMLGRRVLSLDQIESELKQSFQTNPRLLVYLRADENCRHSQVAEILQRLERIGIERVSIRTEYVREGRVP